MGTFLVLQDAVLDQRFGSARRTTVKRVINAQIAALWGAYPWAFKRRPPASVTVVASTRDLTLTAITNVEPIEEVLGLFNDDGDPLTALPNDEFEDLYEQSHMQGDTGDPESFTVYEGDGSLLNVRLGPTPSAAATYKMVYNAGPPTLSADADDLATFGWPATHHELVIVSARIQMTQDENDGTWRELEPARKRLLDAMVDVMTEDDGGTTREFGADLLGYELV